MQMGRFVCVIAAISSFAATANVPVSELSRYSAPMPTANTDLNSRVVRLEQLLRSNAEGQLRLEQMVEQMQQEIGMLRGQTEDQAHQLSQMLERQRQLYQQLADLQTAPPATVVANSAPTAVGSLSESTAYSKALDLATKERRFDDAISAFQEFIQQYPNSDYTANAYYWLGQLLYNQGRLAEAAETFTLVVERYPDSSKRADSILKQGLIAARLGNSAQAQQFFASVIQQYPNTSAAQLAQQQLN